MGYTQYFEGRTKQISNVVWNKIQKDVEILFKNLPDYCKIQEELDNESPAIINDMEICFNGVGDDGHETFIISKEHFSNFDFCKTAAKPYDLAVCNVLMILSTHLPEKFSFNIGSDGFGENRIEREWQIAIKHFKGLFNYPKKKVVKHFPKIFADQFDLV